MKITVLGCGRWGSFITWYLSSYGHDVTEWGREDGKSYQELSLNRKNKYVNLNENVKLTSNLKNAVESAELIVISVLNKQTDILTNVTAVLSCLSNVGPALGRVGSLGDFSFYSNFSKVIFSLLMIAGRLEIFPLLILFSKTTWKKY